MNRLIGVEIYKIIAVQILYFVIIFPKLKRLEIA